MESTSPLIEPCTLHCGLLNEKEEKTQRENRHCLFGSLCHFLFLFPALHLAAPKGNDEWSLLQRGAGRHTGPQCCFCQGGSKGRQRHTARPPFLPKQMLFFLKR